MNRVDSLLQLCYAAHVIYDDCGSTAFIDQWHLSINSLLSCCGIQASTITKSLELHFLLAADYKSNIYFKA